MAHLSDAVLRLVVGMPADVEGGTSCRRLGSHKLGGRVVPHTPSHPSTPQSPHPPIPTQPPPPHPETLPSTYELPGVDHR